MFEIFQVEYHLFLRYDLIDFHEQCQIKERLLTRVNISLQGWKRTKKLAILLLIWNVIISYLKCCANLLISFIVWKLNGPSLNSPRLTFRQIFWEKHFQQFFSLLNAIFILVSFIHGKWGCSCKHAKQKLGLIGYENLSCYSSSEEYKVCLNLVVTLLKKCFKLQSESLSQNILTVL